MSESALVIGAGEVGNALANVFRLANIRTFLLDEHETHSGLVPENAIMHVCFPYSEQFIQEVKRYQEMYKPVATCVHSTVPVGTSGHVGAVHSPVMGLHPNLEESLLTFTKFVGGDSTGSVLRQLRSAGMKVYPVDYSQNTERLKLFDTLFYAVCIEFTKEVAEKLPVFELWTLWTNAYNEGYQQLGHPEFTRPNLVPIPGKIGGHCILPNAEMTYSDFATFILERNKGR